MASTIQLQRTINLAQQFLRLSPLTFAANAANDPAFSNADWVLQTILAPPFAWRWNRNSALPTAPTFSTIIGQSNYTVSLPTFGWIEKATGYDPNNGYRAFELLNELIVAGETLPNEPTRIAAVLDDDAGNITFRLFPPPDRVYNIVVEWQGAAQLFTALTQTWDPIPDYLSYLYNEGFQAKAYEYSNDPRFQTAMQLFITDLAAASEGLSETQKNLWVTNKLDTMRQMAAVQQGRR